MTRRTRPHPRLRLLRDLEAAPAVIRMTKARALEIQAQHVEHYVAIYGPHVRSLVAQATTADELLDGIEYPVPIVNRHIPRGAAIEALIPEAIAREQEREARLRAILNGDRPGDRST